tara:strand:+ start:566 stop:1186 length:621 start_codon:yes stop_codon:yes gene_type:complete
MDYLHKIKQAPVQGLTGLWGGASSNLTGGGGGGAEPAAPFGRSLPMGTGSNWFAPGYFGLEFEESYRAPRGTTLNQIYYTRLQNSGYNWWFLIQKQVSGNEFTTTNGYRIAVPNGSGTSQEGPFSLATYTESFGGGTVEATGDSYLSWHSGVTGESPPGPPHFVESGSGGTIKYLNAPDTTPSDNGTVTYTNNDTGEHFFVHITTT